MEQNLTFKIHFHDEIRRITLPTPTWESFLTSIQQLFGSKFQPPKHQIQYKDEEQDLINVSSNMEWSEALIVLSASKIKHIFVSKKQSACLRRNSTSKTSTSIDDVNKNVNKNEKYEASSTSSSSTSSSTTSDVVPSNDLKASLHLVLDEINRIIPQLLNDGQTAGLEIQKSFQNLLSEANRMVPLFLQGGADNFKSTVNQIMQQVNLFAPLIVHGGLPFIKSCGKDILTELKLDLSQVPSQVSCGLNQLADFLLEHKRNYEARCVLEVLLERDPFDITGLYNLSCVQCLLGDTVTALATLKRAVLAGYSNFEHMSTDPDLEALRTNPDFIQLISQHQPDSYVGKQPEPEQKPEQVVKQPEPEQVAKQPVPEPVLQPIPVADTPFANELKALNEMGFLDDNINLALLSVENGNLNAVIQALLN